MYTMGGVSLKQLYRLVFVLLVFVSFISPFTAEARGHKHRPKHDENCYHHPVRPSPVPPTPAPVAVPTPPRGECGATCSDSNDCDWPCRYCYWQNQTCIEEPIFEVPPPALIPIQAPTPAPMPMPYPPHGECGATCSDSNDCDWPCSYCYWRNQTCIEEPIFEVPPPTLIPTPAPTPMPYPPHGECGATCSDSNDCDWPCSYCYWQNQTCIEEPIFEVPPPTLIPTPTPAPTPMPYPPHGECGATCRDSNDCDWPCTSCCWQNQTCCMQETFFEVPPLAPAPVQALTPAPTPNESLPPYIHSECGSPCSDSNDCDWPCTLCCGNKTCCFEEPFDLPLPPSPSPSSPLPTLQQPPSPPPSLDTNELAPQPSDYDEVAPQPSNDEYTPYPEPVCRFQACRDSNDCDWPCTECCSDYSCCYKPRNWAPEPVYG